MESPQPTPAPSTGLPPGVEPGDVGKRVVAYLIDWAAPVVVIWVLSVIGALAQSAVVSLIIGLVSLLLAAGWVIFVWWNYVTKAASPGKQAMGLQLVGFSDGRPLSWGRVILRWLVQGVIAGTGIGAILMLVFMLQSPRRQTWPDQIVDSVVIKRRPLAPKQLPGQQHPAQQHPAQQHPAQRHPGQQPSPGYQQPVGPASAGDRGGHPEQGLQTPVRYGQADRYGRGQYGNQPGEYQQAGQQGYGQNQYEQQAPRQDQYGQDQYGQDQFDQGQYPPGQDQYGQDQYGQDQYGQGQYGQDQYGHGQDQYGQDQYGQDQYPQDQYGQDQYPQDQYPQGQYGQDQYGQAGQYPQDFYGQDQGGYGAASGVTPVPAPIPGATQFPAAPPPSVSSSAASAREPDPRPLDQGWRAALDDGREIEITGLVLLGRNPQARPGEEDAQLIKISDESRTVSKTHLAIGVDAGGIYVMDRGSTNGSTATDPDGQSRPCAPGDVVQVDVGTIVSFGDHWLEVKRP
ncbi:MAG TPA: RDD family protein [Microlunatus sp.]|nr:RDD family protein [Microlunatus sp.]